MTQDIYIYKGFVNLTGNKKKFFLEFPIKIRGILNFRQPAIKSGCFTERAIDL